MTTPLRRITVWFDGYEMSAAEIVELVGEAEVLAGEARYSARNVMNRDSLNLMAELAEMPYRWPIVGREMDDDSLNCLALAVRLSEALAEVFRLRIAELAMLDYAGIWEDISDSADAPLIVGGPPWRAPGPPTP
jgi:hypothetical protein